MEQNDQLRAALASFETAARYQMYHALALFAVAYAVGRWPGSTAGLAGTFFIAGIVIFSGTCYALALGGPRFLGAITPLGGISLMIGWALLAFGATGPVLAERPPRLDAASFVRSV